MKLVRDILPKATAFLKGKDIPQAKRTAEELLAHLLGCKRLDVYMQFDTPLKEDELETYRGYLRRASQNEPYEYITGYIWFGGVKITVTKDVLIPRPETELILTHIQKKAVVPRKILDMCTGSGCLAIALKKMYPEAEVFAADISKAALDVARANARANGVDVTFIESDMFSSVEEGNFDIIVSNPPYITEKEYEGLQLSVKEYEPKIALVGGADGLKYYRELQSNLSKLSAIGLLAFEIGTGQGGDLFEIFKGGEVEKDWASHDRFFFLDQSKQ